MKATLIIDADGPNPDFRPPGPRHDRAAHRKYCREVPHSIPVLAGTVLEGPDCWIHCFPDGSGLTVDEKGKPKRIGPGLVRAVPADDECREEFEHELASFAAANGMNLDAARKHIDRLVADARRQQQVNDAARDAVAKNAAPSAA